MRFKTFQTLKLFKTFFRSELLSHEGRFSLPVDNG